MAYPKVLAYAWKVKAGDDQFSNEIAYSQALQQVLDQVRGLPPTAKLITAIMAIDDGETEDNDGSQVHVYHWEVTYAIETDA